MKKLFKVVGLILAFIILLAVILVGLLVTLVKPEQFKPVIKEEIKKYTGRDLVMDGDLSWTFYPNVGVKVGHFELLNPDSFSHRTFSEANSLTVGVKLLPLLHKKVEANKIELKGVKLYLIKTASGKTNWEFKDKSTKTLPATSNVVLEQKSSLMPESVTISEIDVQDANVYMIDETTQKNTSIEHLNFHAQNIALNQTFPMTMTFDLLQKRSDLSVSVKLNTQANLNMEKQLYVFSNLNLQANVEKGAKHFPVQMKGELIADLQHNNIQLNNLTTDVSNLNLTGKVFVNLATHAVGEFDVQPFDLKTWLQNTGQKVESLQVAKNLGGHFSFNTADSFKLQGKFNLDTLETAKIKLSNIHFDTRYHDDMLDINPITADLYQGKLVSNLSANLKSSVPQITLNTKLTNVQAEPLLKDLNSTQKFKLQGVGNVDLNVTTSGMDANTILKNLNGTSKITFNNGVLEGIDLGYYAESAYKLVKQQTLPSENSNKTTFGTLNATAVIKNGVINNTDLTLNSPRFDTKGNGIIDLVNQQISYTVLTSVKGMDKNKDDAKNLYGLNIAILIKGSLNNPSIQLDVGQLAKVAAQKTLEKAKEKITNKVKARIASQLKDKIPESIKNQIKDKVPGKAGELLQNFFGN